MVSNALTMCSFASLLVASSDGIEVFDVLLADEHTLVSP